MPRHDREIYTPVSSRKTRNAFSKLGESLGNAGRLLYEAPPLKAATEWPPLIWWS